MRIKHYNRITLDERNWEAHVQTVRAIPLARTAEGKLCWLNPDTTYKTKEAKAKSGTACPTSRGIAALD